jgi:hypothetical protein
VSCRDPFCYGNYPLTHNEALAYVKDGTLPENFAERVELFLEFAACPNCDNVRCMHFVMRDWYSDDIDRCGGWCCPDCSDMKDTKWVALDTAETVGSENTSPGRSRKDTE